MNEFIANPGHSSLPPITIDGCPLRNSCEACCGADYVCRYFAPCAGIDERPGHRIDSVHAGPVLGTERLGKQMLRGRQLSARGAVFECTLAGHRVRIKGQARLYLQGNIEL